MRLIRRSSAVAGLALLMAVAAFAAEQKPAEGFEAVAAPELILQPPDLERKPPADAPAAGVSQPGYWGELQQGLNEELDKASAGTADTTDSSSAAGGQETSAGRSTGMSLLRGVVATCLVVALILVCYYLANRYGKKSPLFAGSSLGRILGRLHLSPKAELYFVRVKDRVLVVGVTPNDISRVAEFDAALFDDAQPESQIVERPSSPSPSAFVTELRAHTLPEPTPNAVSDELAALRADLDKARQYFRESSGESGSL